MSTYARARLTNSSHRFLLSKHGTNIGVVKVKIPSKFGFKSLANLGQLAVRRPPSLFAYMKWVNALALANLLLLLK